MNRETTPVKLDLKKDERLTVEWQDGRRCVYTLSLLRTQCPCALCKTVRAEKKEKEGAGEPGGKKRTSLSVLPGNFSAPLAVTHAELVGNYALRIDWSDGHNSGIY